MKTALVLGSALTAVLAQTPTTIISIPPEAEVRLNGERIGSCPLEDYPLAPGPQELELVLEGYAPAIKEITIQEAQHLTVEFRLRRLYEVIFRSEARGLEYLLDGKYRWGERKIKLLIEEGEHLFQVYRGEQLIDERQLLIDGNLELDYPLPDENSPDQEEVTTYQDQEILSIVSYY